MHCGGREKVESLTQQADVAVKKRRTAGRKEVLWYSTDTAFELRVERLHALIFRIPTVLDLVLTLVQYGTSGRRGGKM